MLFAKQVKTDSLEFKLVENSWKSRHYSTTYDGRVFNSVTFSLPREQELAKKSLAKEVSDYVKKEKKRIKDNNKKERKAERARRKALRN